MEKIKVYGGCALNGEIEADGSKNAALPIIFATVATDGISELSGVPDIGDVRVAIEIIEKLGAVVTRVEDTLVIDTRALSYKRPERDLTSRIRASSYLIGACLARFGEFHLSEFGGCNFCNRPIDLHICAAEKLGVTNFCGTLTGKRLVGNEIRFPIRSVGATINAIIMATAAKGETRISPFASEPHVKTLIEFLISAGAKIDINGDELIVCESFLHGGRIRVIPDMIEAGTYLLLAPLTEGRVTVKNAANLELDSFFDPIYKSGVDITYMGNSVTFSGAPKRPIYVKTAPHPGYPTDLQPEIAPLMAKYYGGNITESVWQDRFSYLSSLKEFGVRYNVLRDTATVERTNLHGGITCATDLRGGAAALMCALSVPGESEIKNAELIARGYSNYIDKLSKLGAKLIKE